MTDKIAADMQGQVEGGSIFNNLMISYGKIAIVAVGGILSAHGIVSQSTFVKWTPFVIVMLFIVIQTAWSKINQHYKEIARSILPTDASMEKIKILAAELNPVLPTTTTTVIDKEGEVHVEEK